MSDFFYRQLAKASGCKEVCCGQNISLKVDLALAHDGTGPQILDNIVSSHPEINGKCRTVFTLDHSFPAPTIKDRRFHRKIHDFAADKDSIRLYENGEGVLHQVVAEEELLWPGMIIAGADGHVSTAGALSAIAFSVSPGVFVDVMGSGQLDLVVPDQVVITLEGVRTPQVMARDVVMYLMAEFGDEIAGKAVVLTGRVVDGFTISQKMSLCNLLPEAGVATALVLPEGESKVPDIEVDVTLIQPMIAVPGSKKKFKRLSELNKEKITVAIAGGCSSGRLDDMQIIAGILAGKKVHTDVTFIVTPGSRNVMESMDKLKISSILRNAGAIIMSPGCGPCPGKHYGVLCESDVAITTTVSNRPGRIGADGAAIYLASPATVALAAVEGQIGVS